MTRDLFWFIRRPDPDDVEAYLEAYWLMNNKLDSHLFGVGFREGAD